MKDREWPLSTELNSLNSFKYKNYNYKNTCILFYLYKSYILVSALFLKKRKVLMSPVKRSTRRKMLTRVGITCTAHDFK